ncbi:MAG: trehalose-phosphatase [Methylibium sp.]|uniref:trehalose-phosphatase n=1 Tax=Methylibium sp. TaxID=2067992 RepID=UPI0017BC2B8A|nr:trehalose-phosphatase [Methylibium sp.]MBA3595793.1 trehalose-phosphatase [Methylibium sp.]
MVRVVNDDAPPLPQLHPRCALFLDFDGTLTPIMLRPQDVEVGAWLVPTLRSLQSRLNGALAIISGRPLSELDAFLAPLRLPAAGVHGVERRDAQGRTRVQAGAPPADVLYTVERVVARYPELRLERKPSALALHYREAPHLGDVCQQTLLAAVRPHQEDWTVLLGKCVVEFKPKRATKAHAVIEFMESEEFAGRVPLFIGDDATDEDGFTAVQAAGGAGVKVGPGPSGALHRLADPDAVRVWLQAALAQWPQSAQPQSAP